MLDRRSTSVFFNLLQAGLWESELQGMEFFPLSDREWTELFQMAVAQTVEAIVFDAMIRLPGEFLPPRKLVIYWLVRKEKIEQLNRKQSLAISLQSAFFRSSGLCPVLVKGQGIGRLYPNQYSRVCGDIDWAFQNKMELELAVKLLQKEGLKVKKDTSFSALTTWFGSEVDLHGRIFDLHNPLRAGMLEKFKKKEEKKREEIFVEGFRVVLPSVLEQLVIVNSHILKHMLAFGIGLRQLCDMAVLYAHFRDKYEPAELRKIYSGLGLAKWAEYLHSILVHSIGLPQTYLPWKFQPEYDVNWILEDVLQTGNFGFYYGQFQPGRCKGGEGRRINYWIGRYMKFFPLAPSESLFFPFVQLYAKIKR